MKKYLIFVLVLLPLDRVLAQQLPEGDFFIKGNDTIYCNSLLVYPNPHLLLEKKTFRLDCTSNNGETETTNDIFIGNVTGFQINKRFFALLEQGKSKVFYWRKINGPMKLFTSGLFENPGISTQNYSKIGREFQHDVIPFRTPQPDNFKISNSSAVNYSFNSEVNKDVQVFFGEYIRIFNNRDVRKKIKPLVTGCEEFTKKYRGPYRIENLEQIIKIYNGLCK